MHTRSLNTFVRIAQIGSFARVAEELNTTLPTVSMQMKTLEESLGVALFDRSFRPPKLTPLGRVVARHAASVAAAEAELKNACSDVDELSGIWRIGFVATASVRLLPDFLSKAKKRAPRAEFELETALSEVLETRVLSGQLDVAVVTASGEPQPGLRYKLLREEKLVYAIPPGHHEFTPAELINRLQFIQFNPNSGIGKLIADRVRDLQTGDLREPILLDSVEAIMECVNAGLGFTLLSEPDIRRYAGEGVEVLDPGEGGLTRRLVLAAAQKDARSPDMERLTELFD